MGRVPRNDRGSGSPDSSSIRERRTDEEHDEAQGHDRPVPVVMARSARLRPVTVHGMAENIRPVTGFPGYFVTDQGAVFSTRGRPWHPLKPQPDHDGYLHVVLRQDNRSRTVKVQRIVASEFMGTRPDGHVVCHRNGDKLDNRAVNLRFDTQKANIADIKIHGTENPPRGERNGGAKLTAAIVLAMRHEYDAGRSSCAEIGRKFGISRRQAYDICKRMAWRHVQVVDSAKRFKRDGRWVTVPGSHMLEA